MTHFQPSEFMCKCERPDCDAAPMNSDTVAKLEVFREAWGKPIVLTSARRCTYRNKIEGGAPHSYHLVGQALDTVLRNHTEALDYAKLARECGFCGVGIGKRLVHIDTRKTPYQWTYNF